MVRGKHFVTSTIMVTAAYLVMTAYFGMKKVKNANKPLIAQNVHVSLNTVKTGFGLSTEETRCFVFFSVGDWSNMI